MKHPQHVWFAVDFDGEEWMYAQCPKKQENTNRWVCNNNKSGAYGACGLPDGTIQHITGKRITWEDKPLKWKPAVEKCKCIRFVGGTTWHPNGCKIHPEGR